MSADAIFGALVALALALLPALTLIYYRFGHRAGSIILFITAVVGVAGLIAMVWNTAIDLAGMHAAVIAGSKLRAAIVAELETLKIPATYIAVSFVSILYLSAMPRLVDFLTSAEEGKAERTANE